MPPKVPYSYRPQMQDGNVDSALPSFSKVPPFRFDSSFVAKIKPSQTGDGSTYGFNKKTYELIMQIKEIADRYGVDPNIIINTASKESSFNPLARNGAALGLFQFSPDDWKDVQKRFAGVFKFTDNGRTDPLQSITAMALRYRDYERRHRDAGIPYDHTSLYMRHFLGPTGGYEFLRDLERFNNNEFGEGESVFVSDARPGAAKNNGKAFYKQYDEKTKTYSDPRNYREFFDFQAGYFKDRYNHLWEKEEP